MWPKMVFYTRNLIYSQNTVRSDLTKCRTVEDYAKKLHIIHGYLMKVYKKLNGGEKNKLHFRIK